MYWRTNRRGYLVAALLAAAGAPAAWAATHEVLVRNFEFVPAEIVVAPGDTVHWVWQNGSHTVTSGTPCVHDGLFFDDPMTFDDPDFEFVIPDGVAEIPYFCRPHCNIGMTGMIRVSLVNFVITLDGDQEVPPVDTTATGTGSGTLDTDTNLFSWNIEFSGLEGNQTAAHFHGPARQCLNAGVQITLPLGSPIIGSQVITAQQASQLLAGLWYVNIHSDLHPAGEIRGQVMPAPLADPIPDPIPPGEVHVQLETVAGGLTAPNWGTFAPGHPGRLVVTDQDGILWAIDLDSGSKSVFLDVSDRLVELGVFGPDSFDERGLLGVAFHPDYPSNGLLYTYTSEPVAAEADFSTIPFDQTADHQSVVLEWQVPDPGDENSVVDPGSARELLRIDQPQFNHNAGCLNFGPDGMLYVALGDGGGADDKDGQDFLGERIFGHGCAGNGADNQTVLGALLRIDPLGSDSANGQYGIPPDNPFVGSAGIDEIFAYGFRNPFRFSFDSAGGELFVADVGQNHIEEVDLVVSGGNYGWNYKEGTFYFVANGNEPGYVTDMPLDVPGGLSDPLAQYDHDEGTAVIGGFVYRGSRIAPLAGRYVLGDWSRTFQGSNGRLFYLDQTERIVEFQLVDQAELGLSLHGFGQDAAGEIYVLGNTTGTPFGTSGAVLRLRLRPGDLNGDGCVDQSDLGILLSDWGCTGGGCAGDIDGDGDTGQSDLGILLANWGQGC